MFVIKDEQFGVFAEDLRIRFQMLGWLTSQGKISTTLNNII